MAACPQNIYLPWQLKITYGRFGAGEQASLGVGIQPAFSDVTPIYGLETVIRTWEPQPCGVKSRWRRIEYYYII